MSPTKKAISVLPIATPLVSPSTVSVVAHPLALNVKDAAKLVGVPEWTLREGILLGRLDAKKCGRTHVVLTRDLQRWLDSLDAVKPSSAPSLLARKGANV
jgi:hypothetical protein